MQLLIEDDVDVEADVNDVADAAVIVAEKAVKWCQDRIKASTAGGTVASTSGSLTAKLPKLTLPSFGGDTRSGSYSGISSPYWLAARLTWRMLRSCRI